jgi:hypothetical protein
VPLRRALERLDAVIDEAWDAQQVAAKEEHTLPICEPDSFICPLLPVLAGQAGPDRL